MLRLLPLCVLLLPSVGVAQTETGIISWGWDHMGVVAQTPDWEGDWPGMYFTQVSAGTSCSFVLRRSLQGDRGIYSWGRNDEGQRSLSGNPGSEIEAISPGWWHTLVLWSDGSIRGHGQDDFGQVSNTPTGTDFIQVAGGGKHSLALRSDGTIGAWGRNDEGQSSQPSGDGFVQVDAGYKHSLALKADGSIVSWGHDQHGQVSNTPTGNGFVQVAAGYSISIALKADGSIVSWGNDWAGQVSDTPPGMDFMKVAAGEGHCLALKADGSLVAWGRNSGGDRHLCPGGQVSDTPPGNDFIDIAVGCYHSVALYLNRVGLTVSALVAGQFAQVSMSGCSPGEGVLVAYSLRGGGMFTPYGISGISKPLFVGPRRIADATGNAAWEPRTPYWAGGSTIYMQGLDLYSRRFSNTLALTVQ